MAEQGCLLSSCAGNRAEGSNPSLSAARSCVVRVATSKPLSLRLAAPVRPPVRDLTGIGTGAVLAGARVALVETGRGLSRAEAAAATGSFGLVGLWPVRYAVFAAHSAFAEGPPVEAKA